MQMALIELTVKVSIIYMCNLYLTMIILKSTLTFITVLACPLTCQNNGKLNAGTCTCDCADGYSGVGLPGDVSVQCS